MTQHFLENKKKLEQVLYVLKTLQSRVKLNETGYSRVDGICTNVIVMFNREFYSNRDWENRLRLHELIEIFGSTIRSNNIKVKEVSFPVYDWLGNKRKYLLMSGRYNMWTGFYGRNRLKFLNLVIEEIEDLISTL
jgi:hypothetical protein